MQSYRLLLLDKNGTLLGTKLIDCAADNEAIAAARTEAQRCEYVEVWNGGHPVCACAKPLKKRRRIKLFRRR